MTDNVAHAIERSRLITQINDCYSCHLHTAEHRPWLFKGRSPNPLMVVREHPGPVALLDRLLTEANLPPAADWFISNVISCKPVGKVGKDSIKACGDNLRAAVKLCDPKWVLLLGNAALAATGVKSQIGKVHGRSFLMPVGPFIGRRCFATYHPAVGTHDEKKLLDIKADLPNLKKLIEGSLDSRFYNVRIGRGGKVVAA